MFDNPLSRSTAIAEALLILTLAAGLGWLIARLLFNGRLATLQKNLDDRRAELADCQATKTRPVPAPAVVPASRVEPTVIVVPEPIGAEPMLPVVSERTASAGSVVDPAKTGLVAAAGATATLLTGKTNDQTEADTLARIALRANELNFDRIGLATVAEADDLKDIVGVGPFLERKLHSLGIYTFRQVANFNREDIDKVNDIIEFFPGRIDRDNWVAQSKVFYEKKYGGKA
jgi:predicted flap endonuclease-1-like 5' DNA nuclease